MDPTGSKEFDFDAACSAIEQCKHTSSAVQRGSSEAMTVLSSLAFEVQQQSLELGKMFKAEATKQKSECLYVKDLVCCSLHSCCMNTIALMPRTELHSTRCCDCCMQSDVVGT